jgi:acetylornithine deacetylase/succinyl-diaminopimelate desuccinylase-like protein
MQQTNANAVEAAFAALTANPSVATMLDQLAADAARTLAEQRTLAGIASPPFKEHARAAYYLERFGELGLTNAAVDAEGNVTAWRPGTGGGPKIVVCAHLDSVFAEGTDVTVREIDGVLHGPGIGDNARGLAVLLALLSTLNRNAIETVGDILWVGTVGEEELGNLRGVKALLRDHQDIDGFVAIDGLKVTRIVNQATGSHRYEMIFTGPGGHSFAAFGLPSPVHAMGRAIAAISDLQTPSDPKTTFTVGTVRGGTSVNAIAKEARMAVDIRSNATDALLQLESTILAILQQAVAQENKRWGSDKIAVDVRLIGDRPAGATPPASAIIETARRAVVKVAPGKAIELAASSTDSNLAMSLGIPAVTIGGGGEGGGQHSLGEWYKPTDAHLGPQNALLTILTLAGLAGVSDPVLPRRSAAPAAQ